MSGRWKIVLALTLALALVGRWGWRLAARSSPLGEERYLASIFPEADEFGPKTGAPPHYTAFRRAPDGSRLPVGVAFLTTDILPRERGYAGPIHILAGLKPDGTLTAIRVVSHQETPSYTAVIDHPEYGERFAGKQPGDGFIPDQDVDGISRATITAAAVARSVRDASRIVAREVLRLPAPPPGGERAAVPWRRVALVALALILALISFFLRRDLLRAAVLVYSLAVLGFGLGAYLSLGQLANLVLGQGAPPAAHADWYLLLGWTILAALFLGNLFCGWLCPFGALQEALGWGAARLGVKRWSGEGMREATRFRWVYLWLTLLVAFALGMTDAAAYEPFAIVFDRKGTPLHWLFLTAVLAGSCFVPRFWCRFFCPVGVVLQVTSSVKAGIRRKFSLQRDILREEEPEGTQAPVGGTG